MKKSLLLISLGLSFALVSFAQEEKKEWLSSAKFTLEPTVGIQLWSSYTLGTKVYNETTQSYEAVDDRLNFQLRRTRFGFKGMAYERLKYNLLFSADAVGRDVLAGTEGGANNEGFPKLGLWNAYLQWQVIPESDKLDVVFGYQVPQIGRESITAALRSTSMEKAWSQNYLRRHLVGTGPGRAVGVNIGGLFLKEGRSINWSYDAGVFNPRQVSFAGQSAGRNYAPLTTARLVFYLGDPETQHYSTGHQVNYFGRRQGLSVAVAGAYQGQTDVYQKNTAIGTDFLFNWKGWSMDGEWHLLSRASLNKSELPEEPFSSDFQTGYFRTSYTYELPNEHFLEPLVMLVFMDGALDAASQQKAAAIGVFAGQEQVLDLGVNYYLNPDLKFSLHYTHRNGELGEAEAGATFNNYFYQSGLGAIQRGNWLGLGLVAVL
jgi:hypothetical protein